MYKKKFVVSGLATLLGTCSAVIMTPAHAADSSGRAPIEEIIVIGEKAERSLQDSASSISVIAADTLNTMQYKSLTDAVADIPNVISLSGAMPDIRGVSGNGSAGGFNSISGGAKGRVSILIDGVAEPFVADLTGDSGIWDIEQIEVYRGPQSTTNGRNSIAGSMYIKTRDPVFDWEGAARVGYRNQSDYIDTSVMLSGPLIADTLAFRVSAQVLDAETITDDTGYASNPPDYDLNEIKTERVKAKLLWTPADNFQTLLTHSSSNEKGNTGRIYYTADNLSAYQQLFFRNIDTDSSTTSLKADFAISDSISIDTLVAYMDYQWGFNSYEPTPEAKQILAFDENNLTVDTKINFSQNNTPFSGFLGLYYFEREHEVESGGAFVYFGDDKSSSKGIYGELTYAVTDRLDLIAGGRIENESQTRDFTYPPINALLDQDKTIALPKLVIQYDLNDTTTVSLSARKGYNAAGGALNFTAQEYYYFDAETVKTYEAGIRTSLADGSVSLSSNVFYNIYDGYQALSSTRFITNLDEVVSYGAELELLARPNTVLEIRGGIGLLETDIKDPGTGYPAAQGNELNSAPALTANLGFRYSFSEAFNLGISANYVGEYYGDFENTHTRSAGDYILTRINANYETEHWRLAAFINNALEEDAIVTAEPASGRYPTGYAAIVDPRNAGISATYSF